MIYEYLLFNVIVLVAPLVAGFWYRPFAWPSCRQLLALIPVIIGFWIWDGFVTDWWWSFNPAYITGWKVRSLPVEEMLFFIAVPVACLLLWLQLRDKKIYLKLLEKIVAVLPVLMLIWSCLSLIQSQWYTFVVTALFCSVLIFDSLWLQLWKRPTFQLFMLFVTGLTLIFNGYLTARPIVTYNSQVNSNLQIATIPVEDFVYGWLLITLVIMASEAVLS